MLSLPSFRRPFGCKCRRSEQKGKVSRSRLVVVAARTQMELETDRESLSSAADGAKDASRQIRFNYRLRRRKASGRLLAPKGFQLGEKRKTPCSSHVGGDDPSVTPHNSPDSLDPAGCSTKTLVKLEIRTAASTLLCYLTRHLSALAAARPIPAAAGRARKFSPPPGCRFRVRRL